MADIKGAFDNVPHTALLEELHFVGLTPKFINWLENVFTGRTLWFFSSAGKVHSRPLRKGVPQGGVLSPILYILYIRSLEHHVRRIFLIIQFADDTLLHFRHHNIQIGRSILRDAIEALYYFFKHRGLDLNPKKTIVMVFSKKKSAKMHPIQTSIGDIAMQDTSTYLGVQLDSQLNWKAHIDSLILRCQMPLNIIKSVAYVWWGADPSCLLLIYKALILSKLQNSSFLWQQAAKKNLHKLDIVQNTALRKILGVLPSTPIHSMLAETKLMPLKYVAMREADNLIINLMLTGEHTALNSIKELMQREETNPNISNLQSLTKSFRKWSPPPDYDSARSLTRDSPLPNASTRSSLTLHGPISTSKTCLHKRSNSSSASSIERQNTSSRYTQTAPSKKPVRPVQQFSPKTSI
jgi:hypothetical protein